MIRHIQLHDQDVPRAVCHYIGVDNNHILFGTEFGDLGL